MERDDLEEKLVSATFRAETAQAQVKEMGLLIRQLAHALNKVQPKHTLCYKAKDLLTHHGLEPKLLHDEPEF